MLNIYRCKIQPSSNDIIWPKAQVWNRERLNTSPQCLDKWFYFATVRSKTATTIWYDNGKVLVEPGNNKYMGCYLRPNPTTLIADIISPHQLDSLPFNITSKRGTVDHPFPNPLRFDRYMDLAETLRNQYNIGIDLQRNGWYKNVKKWLASKVQKQYILVYRNDQYKLNSDVSDVDIFDGSDYNDIFEAIRAMFIYVAQQENISDEYGTTFRKNG